MKTLRLQQNEENDTSLRCLVAKTEFNPLFREGISLDRLRSEGAMGSDL